MAWTIVKTWNSGDVLPALDLDTYLRDNLVMLHDRGADIASAVSITPTGGFHKVTGTTDIATIAGPTDGAILYLWFTGSLTVKHGTGNISLSGGRDRAVNADNVLAFRSDGTVWKELLPGRAYALNLRANSLLAATAASIDIQNIAGDYHLMGVVHGHSDGVTALDALKLVFNNDTGTNYDSVNLTGSGTTASGAGDTALASCRLYFVVGGANSPTGFAASSFVIPHYAGTANHKILVGNGGGRLTSAAMSHTTTGGFWRSTAAINRITFTPQVGSWVAGSRAIVYTF